MKNTTLFLIFLLGSYQTYAIEIQSKKSNTDRQLYIINPSAKIQKVKHQLGINSAYASKPLVSKDISTKEVVPLINNVVSLDLNYVYKINENSQIGFLGTLHSVETNLNKKDNYLDSFYFEYKHKIFKNFAVNPFLYLPNDKQINIQFDKNNDFLSLGQKKGAIGFKLMYDYDFLQNYNLSAFFSYKKSMAEDKYKTIDQSQVASLGLSSTFKFTNNIDWKNEIYVDQTTNNTPIELLSYINYSNQKNIFHFGAGTGNIQGDGANEFKVFLGLTFLFKDQFQPTSPLIKENKRDFNDTPKLEEEHDIEEAIMNPYYETSNISKYRGIASEGKLKTLPNGQKVKVFKNKITEMPTEKGVVYLTEKDYNKKIKELSNKASPKKNDDKIEIIEAQPHLSSVEVVKNEDDSDPVSILIDQVAEQITQDSTPNLVEIKPHESFVQKEQSSNDQLEKTIINTINVRDLVDQEKISLDALILQKKKQKEELKKQIEETQKIESLITQEKEDAKEQLIETEYVENEVVVNDDLKIKKINHDKKINTQINVPFVKKTILNKQQLVKDEIQKIEKNDFFLIEQSDLEEINEPLY